MEAMVPAAQAAVLSPGYRRVSFFFTDEVACLQARRG